MGGLKDTRMNACQSRKNKDAGKPRFNVFKFVLDCDWSQISAENVSAGEVHESRELTFSAPRV